MAFALIIKIFVRVVDMIPDYRKAQDSESVVQDKFCHVLCVFTDYLHSASMCVNCVVFISCSGSEFKSFCDILREEVGDLKIWAAAFYHASKPSFLISFPMAQPLRTPPAVTREVERSPFLTKGDLIPLYEEPSSPLPSDGPQPKCLYHRGGHHGHTGNKLRDCKQCGLDVANFLTELHVGVSGVFQRERERVCVSACVPH